MSEVTNGGARSGRTHRTAEMETCSAARRLIGMETNGEDARWVARLVLVFEGALFGFIGNPRGTPPYWVP